MQLTCEVDSDSQAITIAELNSFEAMLGSTLPQNYRQHMLTYNGGVIFPTEIRHINYESGDHGISDFYPIKYGYDTIEEVYSDLNGIIPNDFISIGTTRGQGEIIMSLINGSI